MAPLGGGTRILRRLEGGEGVVGTSGVSGATRPPATLPESRAELIILLVIEHRLDADPEPLVDVDPGLGQCQCSAHGSP